MRGGARKGAGRKRGPDKKTVTIKLGVSTITLLHELPKGSMSTFIEKALIAELRKAAIQKHSDQKLSHDNQDARGHRTQTRPSSPIN
jgi:hypothetical protein